MPEGDHIRTVLGIAFAGLAQCVFNSGLFGHTQAIGKRYSTLCFRDLVQSQHGKKQHDLELM